MAIRRTSHQAAETLDNDVQDLQQIRFNMEMEIL
jgi:hypothetical protein